MPDIRFYPTLRIVTHFYKKVKQFKEEAQKNQFLSRNNRFCGICDTNKNKKT